jgi:hypothetical protein
MPFDFQTQLDKLDEVPKEFQGLYSKSEDGKSFVLHGDLAKKLDNSGLNAALEKERKQSREFDKLVKAYQKHGKPEELEAKLEELQKAAAGSKDGQANFEKLKADLQAGHQKALAEKDTAVQQMRTSLEQHLIDAEVASALAELKGNAKLLMPHVKSQVRVFEENGKYVARVVDEDGDPRGDGKGGLMGIKDFVAEMKKSKEFAVAFESSGTTGSGMRPGGGGRPSGEATNLSPAQLISAGLAERTA